MVLDTNRIKPILLKHEVEPWFTYVLEQRSERWEISETLKYIIQNISLNSPILETGCGCGFNLQELSNYGFNNLTGTDIKKNNLAASSETNPKINYFCENGLEPSYSGIYKVIIALNWTYLNKKFYFGDFLDRYGKMLEIDGVIIIDVIDSAYNFVSNNLYLTSDWDKKVKRPSEYKIRLSKSDIENACRKAGFKIDKVIAKKSVIPRVLYILKKLKLKKAIFFVGSLELGGSERQAFNLACFLKDKNYEVKFVGFNSPGKLARLCESQNIPWSLISFNLLSAFNYLLTERPDILLSYTLIPNIFGGLLWRFTGVKKFFWNQRDEGLGYFNPHLIKLAVLLTQNFVTNSLGGKKYLSYLTGKNVSIIPNAVKMEPIFQKKKHKVFTAVWTVSLSGNHDYLTMFKAWAIFNKKNKNTRLLISGRLDDGLEKIRKILTALEIKNSVKLLGHIDNVSSLLLNSHLFLHSSKSEGCSNSTIEAAMAGLPVVAADIPASRDVLAKSNYRFLFPPGYEKTMAKYIYWFYKNSKRGVKIGDANREKVVKKYDYQKNLNKYVNLISK